MQGATGDPLSQAEAPVPAEAVRVQLARILASDGFVSSQRLCRFLRFIVERTLENDVERLKEFVVAMEVFDRNDDYDPSVDSIVRVEARRLRTKLKAYYDGAGRSDSVLIGLRPGSYVPLFRPLQPPGQPGPAVTLTVEPAYTTIAVLPFVNMSPEPEQDYFCDGITEEIINVLASIEGLAVVARTSAFQFKGQALDVREIGHRLGAQVVVEGSVRKSGDRLRITAQAIDAVRGVHLWSETYRRELQDVFAIQEEISTAVAATLRAKLPDRFFRKAGVYHPPPAAYERFLKGLLLIHQQNIPGLYASIEEFRALTRLYPDYADPYAGIATAYAALALFGIVSGRGVELELRRNAEHAVHLNPESADGWTVMGGLSAHWDFAWAESDRRFRRALQFQPSSFSAHSWYAMVLTMMGRFDEAESELTIAMRLNPLGASGYARQGFLSFLRGDDARAKAQLEQSLKLEPDFPDALLTLSFVLFREEDYQSAIEVLSRGLDRMPVAVNLGALAAAHARLGRRGEYEAILAKLEHLAKTHYVTPLAFSIARIGDGDIDGALEALDGAVEDRTLFANLISVHPYYDPLRRSLRFAQVLKKLNLPVT